MNEEKINVPEQEETADEIEERFRNNEAGIKHLEHITTHLKKYIETIVEEIKHLKIEVTKQKHCEDDCGRTALIDMGTEIKEYKTEIVDKMPVAVAWRDNGRSGYKTTMDTNGSAYIGKDENGTLVLYIVIYSKFGMYQIRINKKRMLKMLTNAIKNNGERT